MSDTRKTVSQIQPKLAKVQSKAANAIALVFGGVLVGKDRIGTIPAYPKALA